MGLKDLRGNLKDTELRQVLNRLRQAATTTFAGTGFTSTTTAGTAVVGTLSSNGLSMGVPAFLTTAMASNRGSDFVQATATVAGTSISGTISSNVISLSVGPYLTTAMASNRGSDFVQASATIAGTNITGTIASNGISLSVSSGGGGATLSSFQNMPFIPYDKNETMVSMNTSKLAPSTSYGVAFLMPQYMSASFLRLPASVVGPAAATILSSTGSSNGSMEYYTTYNAVAYSLGTGASSKSLYSYASGSVGWTMNHRINIHVLGSSYLVTQSFIYGVEGNYVTQSQTYTDTGNWEISTLGSQIAGMRWVDINFNNSLTPGNYWLIFGLSTNSSTNISKITGASNCRPRINYIFGQGAENNATHFGVLGSSNYTSGGLSGHGSFSTAGGGTTSALPISAISSNESNFVPYFQMLRSA